MSGTDRGSAPANTAGAPALFDVVVSAISRGLWALRVELGLLACVALVWAVGTWVALGLPTTHPAIRAEMRHHFDSAATIAAIVTGAVLAGLLTLRPVRGWLSGVLGRAYIRRRVLRAIERTALPALKDLTVQVVKVSRTHAGWLVRAVLPAGVASTDLHNGAERLAVAMRIRNVVITRDATDAALVDIRLDLRDPLSGPPAMWPWDQAATTDLYMPVPVAVDEHGEALSITMVENNLLLGGEPGSGKSNALQQIVAAAALDPTVRLHLFDGKLVELAAWSPLADTVVGADPHAAADALAALRGLMNQRYRTLLEQGRRKITRGDGLGLDVVVIDELALFLNTGDRKLDAQIGNDLRDLVSRGRAAGLIVIAATQKPSADVIPSYIRDLFSLRWAMRCTTPQASDTVLGQGWATAGYNAVAVDSGVRGGGYLLAEGTTPVRCRAYHLTDQILAGLVQRATQIRGVARLP